MTTNSFDFWPAPAKLNLFLHLVGRRADGYHDLQTLFQLTDFCDSLHFEITADGHVSRNAQREIPSHDDLCVRAAMLLKQTTDCSRGVHITLEKRIPMGGGLGGGSSDAATTLVALNYLWALHLSHAQLMALGATLGADVPVFVKGYTAWGEGIGERLAAVEIEQQTYIVLHPDIHISTASLFAAPELTRDAPAITIRDYLAGRCQNAFEPLVFKQFPQIAAAAEWLSRTTGTTARLTGTGSCIFAAAPSMQRARQVTAEFERIKADHFGKNWQAYCMQGRQKSPLLEKLHTLR